MEQKYILALDQGTSSSRAIVFDHEGRICATAQKEFPQHFPKPGWVEHDPKDIWSRSISDCRSHYLYGYQRIEHCRNRNHKPA